MESYVKMCFGSSIARIPAGVTGNEFEIYVSEEANVIPFTHAIRAYRGSERYSSNYS